jgi:TRAP-type C4-dicarboxylate transport system permease small subunit
LKKNGTFIEKITFVVSLVSYGGVIALMLLNVVDVLMTKALNRSFTGAYEISEVLLLCTVMASFAYGQSKKTHININLIVRIFPRFLKFFVFGVMELLSTVTAFALGYAAVVQAQSSMVKGAVTSVLLIPLYPFYYVEAIAMFVFSLALFYDVVLIFIAAFSKGHEDMVTYDLT